MKRPDGAPPPKHHEVYLGLGSNQGAREEFLADALVAMRSWPEVSALVASAVYESEYVGPTGPQAPYLNLCARLRTSLDARQILARTQELERTAGRDPAGHQLPRTLDIDLLLHGDQVLDVPTLTIPHPRMRERRFVLQPLYDVAPDLRLPPDGTPIAEALAGLGSGEEDLRRWEVHS